VKPRVAEVSVATAGLDYKCWTILWYLGITLESKGMMCGTHIHAVSENSQRIMATFNAFTLNVGGLREARRHLLMSVVHSVLFYGAPTWAPSLACVWRGIAAMAKDAGAGGYSVHVRVSDSIQRRGHVFWGISPISLMVINYISRRLKIGENFCKR